MGNPKPGRTGAPAALGVRALSATVLRPAGWAWRAEKWRSFQGQDISWIQMKEMCSKSKVKPLQLSKFQTPLQAEGLKSGTESMCFPRKLKNDKPSVPKSLPTFFRTQRCCTFSRSITWSCHRHDGSAEHSSKRMSGRGWCFQSLVGCWLVQRSRKSWGSAATCTAVGIQAIHEAHESWGMLHEECQLGDDS